MHNRILSAVMLALTGAAAYAQPGFEELDENEDGRLSAEEVSTVEGLDWHRADADGDASLDRKEFDAEIAQLGPAEELQSEGESAEHIPEPNAQQ